MNYPSHLIAKSPEHETVASRIVNASAEKVFKAWADPNHLKNWWGPAGFTNTFHEFDLRPGGKWKFVMHGPDGKNYTNESEFIEIKSNEWIAFNHISPPNFRIFATFENKGADKTLITFRMIFETIEECKNLKAFVEDKNEENLDRLELELKNI